MGGAAFDKYRIIAYKDTIMASTHLVNQVRTFREKRGWSQADLARMAGLSRPEVSAIETGRLVPSAAAALSLARVFNCSVEGLFQLVEKSETGRPDWAWAPTESPARVWVAHLGGRTVMYPVEGGELGCVPHDGVWDGHNVDLDPWAAPSRTLVIATCDPAVGLLAAELASAENVRLIALQRSSHAALQLLAGGLVHGAGLHLADAHQKAGNLGAATRAVKSGFHLIRVAEWEEGVTTRRGASFRNVGQLVRGVRRWVGRDIGSGARQCQDMILAGHAAPRHTAYNHRSVADAVRSGWAEAGICVRLVSAQAGLEFLSIRREPYDMCFSADFAADSRYAALLRVLHSTRFRRLLSALPGYTTGQTGEVSGSQAK